MTTKRPRRCSSDGCKDPAIKAGKCGAHYMEGYRAGERVREVEDLGPDKARFEFKGPADLKARLHAAVPLDARSRFMRDAVREKLERMASGA